ncbi:MAG: DUF4145 domain-containing protein [Gemmatimonadetes bacterium]|nr:DUF4145 domain-containing protein [Gemmatimonadota bacterium]
MARSSQDLFCTQCNLVVVAREIAVGHGDLRSDAINPLDEIDAEYRSEVYTVLICPRCASPFLVRESIWGIPAEFETVTDTTVLYPQLSRVVPADAPESVSRAWDQASKSFNAALYEPAAIMCRRCLEGVCVAFGATGRNLAAKLDSLASAGVIDTRLNEWAHSVRVVGNEAAHDVSVAIEKEDARDALDFTEALLLYVFTLRRKFERFQERRRPQSD